MPTESQRSTNAIVNVGLGANIILAGLKTAIGVAGHSPALLADGINSTSDVAYYIVVKIFMRLAGKPPDREHPYGHSQLETIASLVVGSFIVATAIAIFWDAVNRVYDYFAGTSTYGGAEAIALWVALFTVAAKVVLTTMTRRVGARTGNSAVLALAYDHRNDVLSAAGAAVGIVLGRAGYPFGDPAVSAIVAVLVLRTGIYILKQSSNDLMDAVPGQALEVEARRALATVPGVLEVEEVHAHRFGPYLVLNVQVGINGALTVAQGDAIASAVEATLKQKISLVIRAYVHCHPARPELTPP